MQHPTLEEELLFILRRLVEWPRYVSAVARAARDILGSDVKVYVVGGAAEDRLTVLSDIDIVVVSPRTPSSSRERRRLALEIRARAVDVYGLPWDYPVDIHVYTPQEFEEARRRYYRHIVEISV